MFIISITVCCFQISSIYQKWRTNPVIITFDQRFMSIGEVPFPAVTICLPVQCADGTAFDYGNVMDELLRNGPESLDHHMLQLFDITSGTCLKTIKSAETREQIKEIFKTINASDLVPSSSHFLGQIGLSDEQRLHGCRSVLAGRWNCSQHFTRIVTPEGDCYTFNTLSRDVILKNDT